MDYDPYTDAVMRDPNKAIEALKEVAKQFQGREIGQALRGLLRQGRGGPAPEASSEQPIDPQTQQPARKGGNGLQMLEQLLKK